MIQAWPRCCSQTCRHTELPFELHRKFADPPEWRVTEFRVFDKSNESPPLNPPRGPGSKAHLPQNATWIFKLCFFIFGRPPTQLAHYFSPAAQQKTPKSHATMVIRPLFRKVFGMSETCCFYENESFPHSSAGMAIATAPSCVCFKIKPKTMKKTSCWYQNLHFDLPKQQTPSLPYSNKHIGWAQPLAFDSCPANQIANSCNSKLLSRRHACKHCISSNGNDAFSTWLHL